MQNSSASSSVPKKAAAAKRAQQRGADEAAMSIHLKSDVRIIVSCFSGACTTGAGNIVQPGWEKIVTTDGAFISSFPITTASPSYQVWQAACEGCLVDAPDSGGATATSPPWTATPTPAAATTTSTATPAGSATGTVTATPNAAATEAASYTAQISNISLENGVYVVSYEAFGYTEQLPGQHVHFYFNTVYEADAGVPGSGPWIVYGGPRPFIQYTEADRGSASSMCIIVANPDHSIIPGSGNCWPLP